MQTQPTAEFSLRHWAAWAPTIETRENWLSWLADPYVPTGDASPKLEAMPPLLRRRANRLGKMALQVLYQSTCPTAPIVYVSRHGELTRAADLLQQLTTSGSISPQSFSVSVHNAIAGLYSIATNQSVNIDSVAAGMASPIAGLIDAVSLLGDGAECVRLVLCDEPVPDLFSDYSEPTDCPYAVLLEIERGNSFRLTWGSNESGESRSSLPPALSVLRFFAGDEQEVTVKAETFSCCLQRTSC